jgi:hypothetical protein
MKVNTNDLIEFFEGLYVEEEQADEIKKQIREDLKGFADQLGVGAKSLASTYALFKKYRSGKNTNFECGEYAELSGIVEGYFASGAADKE